MCVCVCVCVCARVREGWYAIKQRHQGKNTEKKIKVT